MNPAQHILILGVHCYRWVLSPAKTFLFGPLGRCRFTPSCSEYALTALRRHGALAGSWLALKRIGRCHPWGGCGHDPVPPAEARPPSDFGLRTSDFELSGPPSFSRALSSMDRKSILVLVVCFILLMLWYPLVNKLYPPKPLPPGATNAPPALLATTNQPAPAPTAPAVLEEPSATPKPVATANVPEELLAVANANARYTFTSYGGGLKQIELLHYPETVPKHREKLPQTNNVATLNTFTPAPTLALLDGEAVQGDGIFPLTNTASGVRAEKTLTNGLTIVKDFQLSSNYLVLATVRLENRSAQPLALPAQEWFVGTATPMGPRDQGRAVGVLWYNGAKTLDLGGSYYFSGGCRQPRSSAGVSRRRKQRRLGGGPQPVLRPRGHAAAAGPGPDHPQDSFCPAPPGRKRAWWPPTRPRRKATRRR